MAKKEKPIKAKKPIYKKWWFWLILIILIIGIGGNAGKKPATPKETEAQTEAVTEAPSETETEATTEPAELSEKEKIEKVVRDRITSEYTMTDIDSITINDDASTDAEDYIVLVNLTWNQKNKGATSKEVLSLYSSDLAATLGKDAPLVNEVAIFWTVPYLNADAKCSYQRSGEGFKEMDIVFGNEFN